MLTASSIRFARTALCLLYALEAGFVLLVVPWTGLWTQGRELWSQLGLWPLLEQPMVRGLVSGVGLALLLDVVFETFRAAWRTTPRS